MRRRTRIFREGVALGGPTWERGWLRAGRRNTSFGWYVFGTLSVPRRFAFTARAEPIGFSMSYAPFVDDAFTIGCGAGWSWHYHRWPFLKTGPDGHYVRASEGK